MSLSATKLAKAVIKLREGDKLNKFNLRQQNYGAFDAHRNSTSGLIPAEAITAARTSPERLIEVPYFLDTPKTLLTSRSCDIPIDQMSTAMFTLNWQTLGFTLTLVKAEHKNNYMSSEEYMAFEMARGIKRVMEELEVLSVANLEANKTAVVNAGSTSIYAHSGTQYVVPAAAKDDFYLTAPTVMKYNKVFGDVMDIATINSEILRERIRQYGTNNQLNRQGEVTPAYWNFYASHDIANEAGFNETHYITPVNSLGFLNWVDVDAQMANRVHESKYWSRIKDPIVDLDWGVYYKGDCSDETARAIGLDRTLLEQWEFTFDASFVSQIPDAAGSSSIFKFGIQP